MICGMEKEQRNRDTLISAKENCVMFDQIAKRYDVANRMLSFGMDASWRRKAVALLNPIADGQYLDLGTGTGDLVFEIARQSPLSYVDGVDAAEKMLAIARQKSVSDLVNDRLSFCKVDALHLPMSNASYDGVITGFCFRNLEDRRQALSEIKRVLKPNGSIVVLEAIYPESRWVRKGYRLYSPVVSKLGRWFGGGDAYQYLMNSIEDFPAKNEVMELFVAAGFDSVRVQVLAMGSVAIFSGIKR